MRLVQAWGGTSGEGAAGGTVTKVASIGDIHHSIGATVNTKGASPIRKAHSAAGKITMDIPARKAGGAVGRARYMAKTAKRMSKAGHKAATVTTRFVSHVAQKGTAVVSRLANIAVAATARFVAAVLSMAVPIACVVIMAVCMGRAFMMLLSPLGIIGADENTEANTQRVRSVVADVDAEFYARLEQIKAGNPHDTLVLTYLGSPDNVKINNWVDVIAVFAVRTALDDNGMDVVTIDEQRAALIRDVFWDMTLIDYWTEEIPVEFDEEGQPIAFEIILYITVESLTAQQQAANYDFNRDQLEILDLLLSEFRGELKSMVHAPGNWTPEQLEDIYNSLPEGTHAAEVVRLALSRLGDPYSIPLSGTDDYIDCSHLVQWCYAQVGIALPRTAAPQGKYCADNDLTISKDELQPGDLVFWSYEPNGGYLDIGHVGIYVGEGMVINASSVTMEVTLETLFHADRQVLYGRLVVS